MFRVLRLSTLLLAVASQAAAQTPVAVSSEPLTVGRAITEALERNQELIALRREWDAARAAPAQERFLSPPTFETEIWQWPIATLNPIRTDMYMFTGEQALPGRGKRAARVLVGERDADLSRQQIAVRANTILGELQQTFVDLALAREQATLFEQQVGVLDDVAEATALRYAGGQGAQHHTVTTLVELARLRKDRISADERTLAAEARFNTLLGRPVAQPVESLASLDDVVSVADAEQIALQRHPELGLAGAAIAREEAELARLRGERRPDFVVGGGYMLMPGEMGAWTARAGITWPNAPWSRGKLDASVDLQTKRVEAAQAKQLAMATAIRQSVRQAVIRLEAAERQVRLIESTVLPQVEHAFELARVGYTGGEGTFSEVLESHRMLLTTRLEHAQSRADVARARADLNTAAGTYE